MSNGQGLSGPANTWTSFTAKSTVVGGWAVAVSGKSAATATTTTIIKKLCGTFISVSFNVSVWPSGRDFSNRHPAAIGSAAGCPWSDYAGTGTGFASGAVGGS